MNSQDNKIKYFVSSEKSTNKRILVGHYTNPSQILALPNKVKLFEDKENTLFTKHKKVDLPEHFIRPKSEIKSTKKDKRNTGHRKVIESSTLTSFPYSAILRVLVEFTDPDKKRHKTEEDCGTAFLVGPRHAITAAHCIFEDDNWNVWSNYISLVSVLGAEVKIFASRVYKFDDCDLALLILDQDIGNSVGWFGMAHYPEIGALESKEASVTGYPAKYKGEMLTAKGTLLECFEEELIYKIEGTQGQSGGPVWMENLNGVLAIGAITYGSLIARFNGGVRFSKSILETLVELIKETYNIVDTHEKPLI